MSEMLTAQRELIGNLQVEFYQYAPLFDRGNNLGRTKIISWESLEVRKGEDWDFVVVNCCGYGDYCGSTVEKANYEYFMREWGDTPGVVEVYGGYDSHAVGLFVTDFLYLPEMLEQIAGLEDYPLFDDEELSRVEQEMIDEWWADNGQWDFERAIVTNLDLGDGGDCLEDVGFDVLDDDFWELFMEKLDDSNVEFIFETGCNLYIELDKVAAGVTSADLEPWIRGTVEREDKTSSFLDEKACVVLGGMEIVNLCPHRINLVNGYNETIKDWGPCLSPARIDTVMEQAEPIKYWGISIPVKTRRMGEVVNLPDRKEGVMYIVSSLVAELVDRDDLLLPEIMRDDNNKIVGCVGFITKAR